MGNIRHAPEAVKDAVGRCHRLDAEDFAQPVPTQQRRGGAARQPGEKTGSDARRRQRRSQIERRQSRMRLYEGQGPGLPRGVVGPDDDVIILGTAAAAKSSR